MFEVLFSHLLVYVTVIVSALRVKQRELSTSRVTTDLSSSLLAVRSEFEYKLKT